MKKKKKTAVHWILSWAGLNKLAYVYSVLLAIANVAFKIIPYFIIADVVKMFLSGEKEFGQYLTKAVLIAVSFGIAELFHSISTALSHKATFTVLANIRKECCEKLAKVPLGFVKDTPSGSFKNILVERIDSIETTLAHIVPEFTSNLLAPVAIVIYFFMMDWRLALWSLLPIVVGLFSYLGMMLDYKPSFERTVQTTKERKQEKTFLEFIKNDAHYCKYDGMYILFKIGMRISEFTGLTLKNLDMENRTINIDHQLQKTGTLFYIDTTKTYAGTRVIPMQDDVYECFQNIIKARPKLKVEPMIDGYSGFLCFDKEGKTMVAMHWEKYFQHAVQNIIAFIAFSFQRSHLTSADTRTALIWLSLE